jgi:hypothetical protein
MSFYRPLPVADLKSGRRGSGKHDIALAGPEVIRRNLRTKPTPAMVPHSRPEMRRQYGDALAPPPALSE